MNALAAAAPLARRSFPQRILGAMLLSAATYDEVEHDAGANLQAAAVVALVAVCSALPKMDGEVREVGLNVVVAFVLWLVMAAVNWLVGTRLFGGTATFGEMLRTMGFAQAPGVLLLLGAAPVIGGTAVLAVWAWRLVASVVAIRQALDRGTGVAILTAAISWMVAIAIVIGIYLAVLGTAIVGGALFG